METKRQLFSMLSAICWLQNKLILLILSSLAYTNCYQFGRAVYKFCSRLGVLVSYVANCT